MYKHLFGPVPSRRLGMSLGVDLVPSKICSLDCVYCEVGKTTKLSTERKEYISLKKIINEIDDYFIHNPDPDYITFSGAGEPTLNSSIGQVLNYIKDKKPHIPIAILTNATLLFNKSVRDNINNADLILPSLDAATDEVYKKINRPADNLRCRDLIDGLINLRKEFHGLIWLEVFILPGYNDHKEELIELKKAIIEINPDSIQLNTLDRPGTVKDIRPATKNELMEIADFWQLSNVEIIASSDKRKNNKAYREDIESAILETIQRRPCTINDITNILGIHINEANKYLDILEKQDKIKTVKQDRGFFYQTNG